LLKAYAVPDATVQIVMPAMGDSVAEGTVLEWHKQEGDSVTADETVVEISTDKVDAQVPSPVAGTIVKIHAAEDDTVAVGAVLAEIAPDGYSARARATGADGGGAEAPATPGSPEPRSASAEEALAADETRAQTAKPGPPGAGRTIDVVTPAGGESVSEGTILEWSVKVGDIVKEGDTVVEISTDKVDMELPAPASGTITEILAEEGATVTVGQVIARMTAGASAGAPSDQTAAPREPAEPAARPLAKPAPGAQPLKGGAAALARYMDESRSIPTATSFRTITVTVLDHRRQQLKDAGRRVSFTHLIAYAIARAATDDLPVMAHHFAEIDGKPHRVDDGVCNLGLAVDVEKKDGTRTLMVPVIRDAGRLSFKQFLDAYNALVEKARTNTLTADDLSGANLSLTNPGGIGTIASVPRLMASQGTIIATGSIAYPPGLGKVGAQLGAEKVMTMTSTYDHRIIQGAESGRFLQRIEACLHGEDDFYERAFADLGIATLPPLPEAPAPALAPPPWAPSAVAAAPDEAMLQAVQAATSLLKAHRTHGHLAARLDPLGREPEGDPALDPQTVGLTSELMVKVPAHILRMYVPGETLADALPHLRETYCGPLAYEIEHLASHERRQWLREAIESARFRTPLPDEEQRALLKRLTEVDALERFLHKSYLGQQQFSIEGLDMTVPMLDELIQLAATEGAREIVIGMAHRGRLNVLAHNVGRPYDSIFAEFEGTTTLAPITTIPRGGTGDVKYHHGARGSYQLPGGGSVTVRLESNPSHLEYVDPVVAGATRAAQTSRQGPHAHQDTDVAIPIVLHGDAAFPGQGVVAETLNLQALAGYTVGGTIHIIQNNQLGFTTDPQDGRSTTWASDLAKGFDVPIIHVNADGVEACIAAVRLAFAFRLQFGHDVLIDLIGYRRFGHNEADEPAYTQPEMYQAIKKHPPVRELLARQLIERDVVSEPESTEMTDRVWAALSDVHHKLKARIAAAGDADRGTGEYQLDRTASPTVDTAVPADRLEALNEELLQVPDPFTVHPKLKKQLELRREALAGDPAHPAIVWAHAEALALASLLTEGIPVRLTGQDTERGTFSQRHLVLHDPNTGAKHCPIQHLSGARASLELHNSPLSELACLGFEYGYSQEAPETLVLWEAQFGDFANGAQVIIDQFITSGLAKWGQTSRLTLLLPHGYEGSGPEHSSARVERFLQLAAEGNIRVANPSTPAQYFHLLRRQALIAKQRPLVIMTPKSLLRLHQATSRLADLAGGHFQPVLAEPGVDSAGVTRLILCSGKFYYDLTGHAARKDNPGVAIGRVELFYPFPQHEILEFLAGYPRLHEVVWAQEEPRNMGARGHMSPRLMQILPRHLQLGYVGRPERAASGEGYPVAHAREQDRIVTEALNLDVPPIQAPRRPPGER
jgi:multifunctional 2-oxoglutarate metabolism enzyme